MHGLFKTSFEVTDWTIKGTAKDASQVLHNSPARRADYISVSESNILPLLFCATRWVQDKKVVK